MVLVGLPLIAISLRVSGYRKTRHRLEQSSAPSESRQHTANDLVEAESLAKLASIAGNRLPIQATCLRQALLVYWMLRRKGLLPELRIGVQKVQGNMDAHAWVELDGTPVGQTDLTHKPFPAHQVSG